MKRFLSLLAILSMLCSFATAQTYDFEGIDFDLPDYTDNQDDSWTIAEGTISDSSDEAVDFQYKPNQPGDQFVRLNLALELPVKPAQLHLGGTGTLSYGIFLTDSFNLSAKLSFAYTTTIGDNFFYFIPFTLCAQYQILIKNFELPFSVEVGGAVQSYIDRLYFGLVAKPEVGLFYRVSPDWSIGGYAGAYIMPQWYSDDTFNYTGIIADIGLSVRYHF